MPMSLFYWAVCDLRLVVAVHYFGSVSNLSLLKSMIINWY